MEAKNIVTSIELSKTGSVLFRGPDEFYQVFKETDVLSVVSRYVLKVIDKDVSGRSLEFEILALEEIIFGTVVFSFPTYDARDAEESRGLIDTKYRSVLETLYGDIFVGCCPCPGEWQDIFPVSSDGVPAGPTLTSYPVGGFALVDDQDIIDQNDVVVVSVPYRSEVKLVNVNILGVSQTPTQTQITADVSPCSPVTVEIDGVNEGTVPSGDTAEINLEDSSSNPVAPLGVTRVANVFTIVVPSGAAPTNVIPSRVIPDFQDTVYRTGDLAYHWNLGTFDYNDPAGIVQELDPTAGSEYFFRLKHDNAFGNRYRYTDDMGVPAPLGRADFPSSITTPNSAGATPAYVIDHLTGLGYVRQPVGTSRNWNDAVDFCHAFTLPKGTAFTGSYGNFRLVNVAELVSVSYSNFPAPANTSSVDHVIFDRGGGLNTFDPDNTVNNSVHWTSKSRNASNAYVMTSLGISAPAISQLNGAYAVRNHY